MKLFSVLFILFYLLAGVFHPGGFNPFTDFFCNLFQNISNGNGSYELSELLGMLALISISSFVALFFFNYAEFSLWKRKKKLFVMISGVVSAISIVFIFSSLHDELIIVASIVGAPAVALVLMDNLKHGENTYMGLITISLLIVYNAIFYLGFFEITWPLFQKICIILCLIWSNQLITTLRKKAVA